MGLIARINNWPARRCIESHNPFNMVGALGNLESGLLACRPDADLPRAANYLPRHQKRHEPRHQVFEANRPFYKIILVRSVRGSFSVGVIFIQQRPQALGPARKFGYRATRNNLPGSITLHPVGWRCELWAAVLRVGVVNIHASTVG